MPLLIYHGSGKLKASVSYKIAQHADITPTILDFLSLSEARDYPLGRSLLQNTPGRVVNQIASRWWMLWEGRLVQSDLDSLDFKLTKFSDLASSYPVIDRTIYSNQLKAYQQYYINGLLQGSL